MAKASSHSRRNGDGVMIDSRGDIDFLTTHHPVHFEFETVILHYNYIVLVAFVYGAMW